MKQVGSVEVPQEAFLSVLQIGDDGRQRQVSPASATSTCTCPSARRAAATAPSWSRWARSTAATPTSRPSLAELRAGGRRPRTRSTRSTWAAAPPRSCARGACGALMDAIRPRLAEGAEVSIEANPETVDRRALARAAARWASPGSRWASSRSSRTCWPRSTAPRPPTRPAAPSAAPAPPGSRTSASTCCSAVPGPDARRPGGRPGRRPRARPGPRLLVRARAQAGLGAGARRHAAGRTRTRAPTPTAASWRASRRPATAGTRRPTSPAPATSAATAWPTGARPTTSASASAR